MKKAISYMACSMAAMLALSACGSAASSASTVASSSDAASTESTAASEASNEPVTITFAQYSVLPASILQFAISQNAFRPAASTQALCKLERSKARFA